MNSFLNELFQELGYYMNGAQQSISTFEFWFYPIITVLFIWGLTLIFTKFLYQNKNVYTYKKTYYIYHAWIISSLIAATILISVIIILNVKFVYNSLSNDLHLSHLIALLIAFISAIIAFSILRKYYRQYNVREITKLPLTSLDENITVLKAKKSFSRIKVWVLVPSIGFLFLLLLLKTQGNVFSIVFDNSGSVSQEETRVPIEAMTETISKMGEKNTIFFTSLGSRQVFIPYEEIVQIDFPDVEKLNATTSQLSPSGCINELNALAAVTDNSMTLTPLTEAIWQNYLYVENAVNTFQIKKKRIQKLIIISDCCETENVMATDPMDLFNTKFGTIFPIEKVKIIDVGYGRNYTSPREDLAFYSIMVNQLGVETEPGDNFDAISRALQLSLPENNLLLVVWILIVYLLAALIMLLINPAKLR